LLASLGRRRTAGRHSLDVVRDAKTTANDATSSAIAIGDEAGERLARKPDVYGLTRHPVPNYRLSTHLFALGSAGPATSQYSVNDPDSPGLSRSHGPLGSGSITLPCGYQTDTVRTAASL
jgi:hypothetical protein